FIGDANICDFMDVLVDPRAADEGYAGIWSQLCEEQWGELYLWGLMASSPTRGAFKALAERSGYAVGEQLEAVAPRLDLPQTWEDYLASLGKKDRHELRRKIRKVFDSGAGVTFDVYSDQTGVMGAMEDFLALHTGSRQDKTDFMTDEMASF